MENRAIAATPSSRYDDFLFTVISEEPNGNQLSVLSALTRVDIDPWEEAARLSALTEPIAKSRLISVLGLASENSWSPSQKAAIAARLIERLPSTNAKGGSTSTQRSEVNGRMLIFLVFWWSFAIATSIYSSNQERVHKTEGVSAPYSSGTILSKELGADTKTKGATD
jgi:hypothetical protein